MVVVMQYCVGSGGDAVGGLWYVGFGGDECDLGVVMSMLWCVDKGDGGDDSAIGSGYCGGGGDGGVVLWIWVMKTKSHGCKPSLVLWGNELRKNDRWI